MQTDRRGLTLDGPLAVGTDGTQDAHRAVRWAASEARSRGRPLSIVHATRTGSGHPRLTARGVHQAKDRAVEVLDEAADLARETAPGITLSTTACPYGTSACLLGEAAHDGTVVVGTRGHGGFLALLVGSDALRVAARAHVPVVVVPGRERSRPAEVVLVAARDERDREPVRLAARSRPAEVVLVAARDERDREPVRLAADLALRRGAALHVFSAWIFLENVGSMATMFGDPADLAAAEAAEASRIVAELRTDRPGLRVVHDVVRAASAAAVLVAATADADAVVIGSRRRSSPVGAPLGHVTHAVLHHAHCPVLLTPLTDRG
ncbi:universal stress protein [Streptomyces sp. NBC_01102]|uniref:universal stress protein n=1 Tax=Streptomyces sp. NBC_01102 TaxID=2903749 RepID=UPI0038680E9D|nr:universal stress protein [Streptomyces sp. NBC_01102]